MTYKFHAIGSLDSGDLWAFSSNNRARAEEARDQMAEDFQRVELGEDPADERIAAYPFRITGIDHNGDAWTFATRDRDHSQAVYRDMAEDLSDVEMIDSPRISARIVGPTVGQRFAIQLN